MRVERDRRRRQVGGGADLHGGGGARRAVVQASAGEVRQRADRHRVDKAQLARAADCARGAGVKGKFAARVVGAGADAQVDAAPLDKAADACVGCAIERGAVGQVGAARHHEHHRVVEQREVVADIVGHDRADFVGAGLQLVADGAHQAGGPVGGAGVDIGQDLGLGHAGRGDLLGAAQAARAPG
ncbi:hypothetical protein D3C72_1552130 [compost metagenome]